MTTALATTDQDRERLDLIKRTVANGTTDDEFALFMHACRRTGLDPLMRQIHCVKRGGKMTIQTAIDGYRLIADRTGVYAGNDDPIFDDEEKPRKATVTVYKLVGGVRCGFTATARWDQYHPGDAQGFMWKKMPHLMLGKCAEALALRKAFPAELSGVYTNEEMDQADRVTGPTVEVAHPKTGEVVHVAEIVKPAELPERIEPGMDKPTLDQEILDAAAKVVKAKGGTLESAIFEASWFETTDSKTGKTFENSFTDPSKVKSEKWKQKTLGRLLGNTLKAEVKSEEVPF